MKSIERTETLFKPEEIENAGFAFSVEEKRFENGAFRKNNDLAIIT